MHSSRPENREGLTGFLIAELRAEVKSLGTYTEEVAEAEVLRNEG